MSDFELKGRHVAFGFVAAFSVIIGVNLFLAFSAVKTFPGLEVKNSYVASQTFDVERAAQEVLGWNVSVEYSGSILKMKIQDASGTVNPTSLTATIGRATHVRDDRNVPFWFDGQTHTAFLPGLASGYWKLRLVAEASDGTVFHQHISVEVPE